MSSPRRTVVFGAFDRHNLGDLLFAHVVSAFLQDRELVFAGVAARDLQPWGGHAVRAIAEVVAAGDGTPTDVVHAGGELLTCDSWQAAVMTRPAEEAARVTRWFESRPDERLPWGRRTLGLRHDMAYLLPRQSLPAPGRLILNAVGGVTLDQLAPALRQEALARVRDADAVTVRDVLTQSALARAGLEVPLAPDCGVLVAEILGPRIPARRAQAGAAGPDARFPRGYLAVQFAAEFGDDRTLASLAAGLDAVAARHGLGIVLFRAGAAPWHDDLEPYRRLAGRLRAPAELFESLHLLDLCALIAGSRAVLATSLHARIVALAFSVPRTSLVADAAAPSKAAAFISTWEPEAGPVAVPEDVAPALERALAEHPAQARRTASRLASACRLAVSALLE